MRKDFDAGDERIDAVLAALGQAAVPEGLEDRVLRGVERRAARLEGLRASGVAGVWWRGALTGAAAALLAVGVVLAMQHAWKAKRTGGVAARPVSASEGDGSARAEAVRVEAPCGRLGGVRAGKAAEPARMVASAEALGSAAPGLTAEERALVRLAQRGDAQDLDALIPEARAKEEAADAAQFQSFFAPPPPLPQTPDEVPAVGANE